MSQPKEYLVAIVAILAVIFFGVTSMFHYYYFTSFYWDCRSISYMDTQEMAEKIMSKHQTMNPGVAAGGAKDTGIGFTDKKGEILCLLSILDGKVVEKKFLAPSF
jgi:hypothetical protein